MNENTAQLAPPRGMYISCIHAIMQALHHMKKNNKMDQVEGRIATKPTNNKLRQFLELLTFQTSLWVRRRRRRRRRRNNNVGLITREERKVYLWGEGKKREGGRQGGKEREREREREGMHGTQCKSAECM
jgi:hypothetical protein